MYIYIYIYIYVYIYIYIYIYIYMYIYIYIKPQIVIHQCCGFTHPISCRFINWSVK